MPNEELKREYEQRKERTAALTNLTLQSTDGVAIGPPTPTQEENDMLALGLMHPDEKQQSASDKAMPSVAAQQPLRRHAPCVTPSTAARYQVTAASQAMTPVRLIAQFIGRIIRSASESVWNKLRVGVAATAEPCAPVVSCSGVVSS